MGVLLVKCPVTGREFSSGIQVERDELKRFPIHLRTRVAPTAGWSTFWWTRDGRYIETRPPEDWIENKQ